MKVNPFVSAAIGSAAAAFVAMRVYDYALDSAKEGVTNVARASLFVGVWTAVTTGSWMSGFSKRVRGLRQANTDFGKRIEALPKDKGDR